MTMTSRERVLKALAHQPTDRVPRSMGFGLNHPFRQDLMRHLGIASEKGLDEWLLARTDLRWVAPAYHGPHPIGRDRDGVLHDIWGVRRKLVAYGTGSYDEICHHPLAGVDDIDGLSAFPWPSADWFDYSTLPAQIAVHDRNEPHAILIGNGNLFESSWYMRGFEAMLADLVLEPEYCDTILKRVTDFYLAFFDRALDACGGRIDLVLTADDIGQQTGMLMSPQVWRDRIQPWHARLNRLIHSHGAKVLYHTDGAIMDALEGIIDMGVDVLEALQFDAAGMDPVRMKEIAGDRLCFHGGISVQRTLPFGTPEEVAREVRERVAVLGRGGGYILAPSHMIQAGTPVENFLAIWDTAT